MNNPKVIVYVRVSTEDQTENYSLESQTERCCIKACEMGFQEEDIEIIADEVSGALFERPGLTRLREIVSGKAKPEVVLMYDPDRFARNLSLQLIVTEEIVKNGVKLEFVNFDWKNTPEGRMFYQMRGAFSEFEREKIRERTIRGRMTKIQKYKKLSYDPRLYGYKFDKEEDVLVVDSFQSTIVQLIFQKCAKGKSGEQIAKMLAKDGIPAPRGTKWYGSTVTRILRNPSYLGVFWAYKTDYHQGYKRVRPKEEQIRIEIEPIIEPALFDRAQQVLHNNRTHKGRPSSRPYLLSGIAKCYCGKSAPASVLSGNKQYAYYSCVGKQKGYYNSESGEAEGRCTSSYWNTSVVDEVVWDRIAVWIRSQGEWIGELLRLQMRQEAFGDSNLQMRVYDTRLRELVKKKEKLLELYLSDGIDRTTYNRKLFELNQELETAANKKQKLERETSIQRSAISQAEKETDDFDKLQHSLTSLSFEQKKAIVDLLVYKVILQQNREITIELRLEGFSGNSSVSESHGGL